MLRYFTLFPAAIGIAVILVGATGLTVWAAGFGPVLQGSTLTFMLPLTAACFVVGGLALLIAQKRGSFAAVMVSRMLSILLAGVALFILFDYSMGWNNAIDLVWLWQNERGDDPPARMAVNTALAFALFAQGMVFLEGDRRARGLRSQFFATLTLIIAFLALVGHLFDVRDFYSFQVLEGMELTGAILFVLLGMGLLFSQLDRGFPALVVDPGASGFVSRRLLPGALLVPFALGMLGVLGEERGLFGQRLEASLVAVASMVVFLLLIAWSARVVRAVDRKRGELFVLEREAFAESERARAEAEIAMQQAVAARAEAERANGAKSDFLAVMSHELRTPLAAIMGYQELLADGITGPITEAQAQQLGRIKVSARHLLSLIDEILTFTRLDAGRETVLHETLDLAEAMKDAIEIIEPLAESKNLEIAVSSPGEGVLIESDPTKLRQILVNLLSNAVKFTDSGKISLAGKVTAEEVHLCVSDTGIGIQPEFIQRIFDPFWQVEQKATRRAPGTGLGLTVTRRLANLLGGDVVVSSTPGEGATFTVTLPLKAPHIGIVSPAAPQLRVG